MTLASSVIAADQRKDRKDFAFGVRVTIFPFLFSWNPKCKPKFLSQSSEEAQTKMVIEEHVSFGRPGIIFLGGFQGGVLVFGFSAKEISRTENIFLALDGILSYVLNEYSTTLPLNLLRAIVNHWYYEKSHIYNGVRHIQITRVVFKPYPFLYIYIYCIQRRVACPKFFSLGEIQEHHILEDHRAKKFVHDRNTIVTKGTMVARVIGKPLSDIYYNRPLAVKPKRRPVVDDGGLPSNAHSLSERRYIVRSELRGSDSSVSSEYGTASTSEGKGEQYVSGILESFTSLCLGSSSSDWVNDDIRRRREEKPARETTQSSTKKKRKVIYPIASLPARLNSRKLVAQRRKSMERHFFRPVSEDEMSTGPIRPRST